VLIIRDNIVLMETKAIVPVEILDFKLLAGTTKHLGGNFQQTCLRHKSGGGGDARRLPCRTLLLGPWGAKFPLRSLQIE
jgi:hypothetical protein